MVSTDENIKVDPFDLTKHVPFAVDDINVSQSLIPEIAKDKELISKIEAAIKEIPTKHIIYRSDSRERKNLDEKSIHLVVTSPPYWTLKKYNDCEGQLGDIENYEQFLDELDRVWNLCYKTLVPGGRLICVVGDVCLSRRKNNGRHTVVPLHSSIQERCRKIGFDNLAPIIWSKIANANYEVEGNSSFLGKPYEPNAVIKNDIEYILMLRKPGGYRKPSQAARILSVISNENHKEWFKQIWDGPGGASTRKHPAPFPLALAERLIRMFSFVGDTVFDPFLGTGTTSLAAAVWGRNSIGTEIDPEYFKQLSTRLVNETSSLFSTAQFEFVETGGIDES